MRWNKRYYRTTVANPMLRVRALMLIKIKNPMRFQWLVTMLFYTIDSRLLVIWRSGRTATANQRTLLLLFHCRRLTFCGRLDLPFGLNWLRCLFRKYCTRSQYYRITVIPVRPIALTIMIAVALNVHVSVRPCCVVLSSLQTLATFQFVKSKCNPWHTLCKIVYTRINVTLLIPIKYNMKTCKAGTLSSISQTTVENVHNTIKFDFKYTKMCPAWSKLPMSSA